MNSQIENNEFYSKIPSSWKALYQARFVAEHFLGIKPLIPYFRKKQNKFATKINDLLVDSSPSILKIDELDINVSPESIRKNYIKKGLPFIIRDGIKNWDAFKEWDFEFFKSNYGHHEVILSNHKDLGNEGGKSEITNLAHIIEGLGRDSKKYARFNPLLDVYPELQKMLDQQWLDQVRNSNLMKHHVLFIGNKDTKTDVHCAGNENVFLHVRGTKKWIMWDQRAQYILEPEVNRGPAKASSFNPYATSHLNEAFLKIPRYEATCNEGDIIYVPSYIWHHVFNETATIGVGNRWLKPTSTIANNPMYAFLELFNTSPSVFTTLRLSKGFDFNKVLLRSMGKKNV